MHRPPRRVLGATLTGVSALALSVLSTAGAVAQPAAPAGAQATSEMTLTMPASDYSTGGTVTLECDPTGGTHPSAADACASLADVKGDFYALQRAPGWACHTGYDPVTVTATGHWKGQPISYQETFTNSCEASVGTDFVFKFGF